MTNDEPNTPKVLDWINDVRRERLLGEPLKEIPRGIPGDCENCPIAVALAGSANVDPNGIQFKDESDGFMPPGYVAAWIREFDLGWLPEFQIRFDENGEEIA